jgi:catechol 2,3-dioxygenase-like lactoylglutathione lyase family enzyme
MTGGLCPVLAVAEPEEALDWLGGLPGVSVDRAVGVARCGNLTIRVTRLGLLVPGFRSLPFDHLALRVGDLDATLGYVVQRGARLHSGFTPDGPCEIAAFGPTGVRFAFVMGPSGVPVEFCTPRGAASGRAGCLGLDHLGLRTADVEAATAQVLERSGTERSRHRLMASPRDVEVRFLVEKNLVWEVFDEVAPYATGPGDPRLGWVGVAPVGDV